MCVLPFRHAFASVEEGGGAIMVNPTFRAEYDPLVFCNVSLSSRNLSVDPRNVSGFGICTVALWILDRECTVPDCSELCSQNGGFCDSGLCFR